MAEGVKEKVTLMVKGKLKLIVIVLVLLAVLGGGGFAYKAFLNKKKAAAEAAEAAEAAAKIAAEGLASEPVEEKQGAHEGEAEAEEEDPKAEGGGHGGGGAGGGAAVLIYKNIVNLEAPRKNTYLKLELHILFRDAELGKAAAGDKPTAENSEIRAIILGILSGKKLEEAQDMETREGIRREIKDRLNEKFMPKPPKVEEKKPSKSWWPFGSAKTPKEEAKEAEKAHPKLKKPIKDVLIVDWAIAQG